jgi:putative transposase
LTADDWIEMPKPTGANIVGVDVGLFNWIALSDGETIQNTVNVKAHAQEIKNLQRQLSRKKKGSKNREKARIRLVKAWRKVRRSRDDLVHKTSAKLAQKYDIIVFEKLNINNMVKNHNLAAAIMDATWGKLRQLTAYKVERRGGRVVLVNPSGTSQKCSGCGVVVKKDLTVRMHECTSCGLVIDRVYNAALNILKLGLEQAHAERQPILVRQRISKFASVKQEAHKLICG